MQHCICPTDRYGRNRVTVGPNMFGHPRNGILVTQVWKRQLRETRWKGEVRLDRRGKHSKECDDSLSRVCFEDHNFPLTLGESGCA